MYILHLSCHPALWQTQLAFHSSSLHERTVATVRAWCQIHCPYHHWYRPNYHWSKNSHEWMHVTDQTYGYLSTSTTMYNVKWFHTIRFLSKIVMYVCPCSVKLCFDPGQKNWLTHLKTRLTGELSAWWSHSNFQLSSEGNLGLFCFTSLHDWFKNLCHPPNQSDALLKLNIPFGSIVLLKHLALGLG